MPDIQKVLFLCIVAHNRGKVKYLISINSLKFVSGDVTLCRDYIFEILERDHGF
jgi:hypothetical protein